jgi:hypothetical protein
MDLPSALSKLDIAHHLGLEQTPDRAWNIVTCSAKTREGVGEAVKWVLQQGQKIKPRSGK